MARKNVVGGPGYQVLIRTFTRKQHTFTTKGLITGYHIEILLSALVLCVALLGYSGILVYLVYHNLMPDIDSPYTDNTAEGKSLAGAYYVNYSATRLVFVAFMVINDCIFSHITGDDTSLLSCGTLPSQAL